ncbi:hypothetical protein LP419_15660 [Massilia sp. H-1]|nr:hypothetical protein LP419_15660 [Massilia sp. H-1]
MLALFLYVALSFGSSNANALDGVSCACRFSNLSASFGVQEVAARFFYAIGAPQSVLGLPDASLEEKKKWWVLESLTVDAARARYYLYATSVVYGFMANIYSPDYNKYVALHA